MQRQDFGKLHLSKSRALKAELRGGGAAEAGLEDGAGDASAGGGEGASGRGDEGAPGASGRVAGHKRRRQG